MSDTTHKRRKRYRLKKNIKEGLNIILSAIGLFFGVIILIVELKMDNPIYIIILGAIGTITVSFAYLAVYIYILLKEGR